MIRDALPLAIVFILGIVHYRIDVVILSVMKGMSFLNTLFAHMVIVGNQQRKAVPIVLFAIFLNVLLNILLIPRLGAAAPALVTDVTEGLSMLGMAFIMIRHFHFGPSLSSLARILLSGAGTAVPLAALRQGSPALAAALAAIAYLVALFLTRAVTPDDLRATFHVPAAS